MTIGWRSVLGGHGWTIGRHLLDAARPPAVDPGDAWSAAVADPIAGRVTLTGRFHRSGPAPALAAILVHGLGGSAESGYVRRMAAAASARGMACLRLNLRGADRSGADIYHAGLVDDLAAAFASPELAGCERIAVIGFSLGGHVALRFAASSPARLAAVCAVCAPLDLAAGVAHIDHPRRRLYRRHLLRGLREIHAAAARREVPVPLTVAEAARVRTIREWDERVVAPRFGFSGAADYYARMSVGPALGDIEVPVLLASAPADPMISAAACEPARSSAALERWLLAPGGHVGFPASLGLESRILAWLTGAARARAAV